MTPEARLKFALGRVAVAAKKWRVAHGNLNAYGDPGVYDLTRAVDDLERLEREMRRDVKEKS